MLKKITTISVVLFVVIHYGQEFIEQGSFLRKYFYFCGMSTVGVLMSFLLMKTTRNSATVFLFSLLVGVTINNFFFFGKYGVIDLSFGVIGIVYVLTEKTIKKCVRGVRRIVCSVKNPRLFLYWGLVLVALLIFSLKYTSLLNTLFHF